MDTIEYIKEATTDSSTPWVLYRNGTLVFLPGASGYLEKLASDLLKTEGPVVAGTPSGDFSVTRSSRAWFVKSHHADILTVVTPDEVGPGDSDLKIGLLGRSKRDLDAKQLEVVHVYQGSDPQPREDLETDRLSRLEAGDASPMVDYLMGSDDYVVIEDSPEGITVYPESRSALHLGEPWGSMFLEALSELPELVARRSDRGTEVKRNGALYYLRDQRLEESRAKLLVTGVERNGRMSGGTAQAILSAFGPETEDAGRELLAGTDRSLGTTVVAPLGSERWLAYVVSTPKHTPESPGWLVKAVRNLLDEAAKLGVNSIASTALGTNGGIESEEAAKLMLQTCQRWFEDNRYPVHITFCLPHAPVREAFEREFRRRRIFFSDRD